MGALANLRQVNEYLRGALIRLRPEQKDCATIRPRDFSDLHSEILRAAESLRGLPLPFEAALADEALEYRRNLEKLAQFLPELHGRLLAKRGDLEAALTHVAAAGAWARGCR